MTTEYSTMYKVLSLKKHNLFAEYTVISVDPFHKWLPILSVYAFKLALLTSFESKYSFDYYLLKGKVSQADCNTCKRIYNRQPFMKKGLLGNKGKK